MPERLGALLADVAQGELAALAAEATRMAKWRQEGRRPRDEAEEEAAAAKAEEGARGEEAAGGTAPPSGGRGGRQLTVQPAPLKPAAWSQPGGFSFAKVARGEGIALKARGGLTKVEPGGPSAKEQGQARLWLGLGLA